MLDEAGLALHNLASLPHISVAGAVATATHGSGDGNGNLATRGRRARAGHRRRRAHQDRAAATTDFDGMVVNLGALGVVTRVTLDAEPVYEVRQRVFEGIGWPELLEHYDAVMATGYSVSVFTSGATRQPGVGQEPRRRARPSCSASRRDRERHPIPGIDPVNCTAQLGVPGPWYDRLPHFRMGFTPSRGGAAVRVPRAAPHAAAAIEAVRALADGVQPLLQVTEIRTIAADRLWLSPQYERDSVAIHFTWNRDPEAVERVLAASRRGSRPSTPARTGASCSCTRRGTHAATTSSRWPRDSTPTASSTTAGSNGI